MLQGGLQLKLPLRRYDYATQLESVRKLLDWDWLHVLPGGWVPRAPAHTMCAAGILP
jgi:hypothetical protein